jgi:hypothetical protein
VLSAARKVRGELAALRGCRAALLELAALVNRGVRDPTAMRPLAEAASGKAGADALLELLRASAGPVRIVELTPDAESCPACHMTFPLAAQSRLKKATNVHRCSNCGVLLVRSLES